MTVYRVGKTDPSELRNSNARNEGLIIADRLRLTQRELNELFAQVNPNGIQNYNGHLTSASSPLKPEYYRAKAQLKTKMSYSSIALEHLLKLTAGDDTIRFGKTLLNTVRKSSKWFVNG